MWIQYTNVTDRRTPDDSKDVPRLRIASRDKNYMGLSECMIRH